MSTLPYPNTPKNPRHSPRRRRHPRGLAALALAAATLAGCATNPAAGATAQAAEQHTENQPPRGGVIEYGHLQEPNCLYGGWTQEAFTSRQVLDSLVSQTDEGEIVPWLATDWEVSDDGLVWTFQLLEDIAFTDGTALDAEAVAYNFEYWVNGGNGTSLANIGGFYEDAKAVDEHTVEVALSARYNTFLSALSQSYFGIQSPTALESRSDAENCREPIGSGPFTVEEWKRGEHIEFARNDNYDSAPQNARHQGPAYVDGIKWRFIPENTSRFGSLSSGESDAIGEVPAVNVEEAEEHYEYEQYIMPGRPIVINLNTERGVFSDVGVRQALSYATDREANIESAFLGTVPEELNAHMSRSTPMYDDGAAEAYPFDLDEADRLLDDAGWTGRDEGGTRTKDGARLEAKVVYGLNSIITPDGNTAIQNFQEQARSAGFDLTLRPMTQSEMFGGTFATPETRDAYIGSWTSSHPGILNIAYRPGTTDNPNGANQTFLADEEPYEVIQRALHAGSDSEARDLFSQAQHELNELAPAIGLYDHTNSLAVSDSVEGIWLEASQGGPVFHDAHFVTEQED